MEDVIIFIFGALAVLWSSFVLEHLDRPHKPQHSNQRLLEPYEVANEWYQTISKENTKKTSRHQA